MSIIFDAPYEPVETLDTHEPLRPASAVRYVPGPGQEPVDGWVAVDPSRDVTWVDDLGLRVEGRPLVFVSDAGLDQVPWVYTNLGGRCLASPSHRAPPKAWVDDQGMLTPALYTEQVRRDKMATRVAKVHGRKRGDGSSVGLFLPLPGNLARKFPSNYPDDESPSHVTLMILGDIPEDRQDVLLDVVGSTLRGVHWPSLRANLAGLGAFEGEDRVVPHAKVEFDRDVEGLRWKLQQALREKGLPISGDYPSYKPHVTLGYLPAGEKYRGKCPKGAWDVSHVEVWGLPKVHRLPIGNPVSKVASRWLARRS